MCINMLSFFNVQKCDLGRNPRFHILICDKKERLMTPLLFSNYYNNFTSNL